MAAPAIILLSADVAGRIILVVTGYIPLILLNRLFQSLHCINESAVPQNAKLRRAVMHGTRLVDHAKFANVSFRAGALMSLVAH